MQARHPFLLGMGCSFAPLPPLSYCEPDSNTSTAVQVVEYARQYKFSQAEYDELYTRLQQLERLMKQHDVSSADELLQLAEEKVRLVWLPVSPC